MPGKKKKRKERDGNIPKPENGGLVREAITSTGKNISSLKARNSNLKSKEPTS